MPFIPSTSAFILFLLLGLFLFSYGTKHWPNLWKTLPRQRIAGVVMAFICLLWAADYAFPMFEGQLENFKSVLKILIPVLAVLSFFFLNFLFTRALGGLLLLSMSHLLHQAFVAQLPMRGFFAVLCYSIIVAGILCLAVPWHFRDLMEKTKTSTKWRLGTSAVLLFYCIVFIALTISETITS